MTTGDNTILVKEKNCENEVKQEQENIEKNNSNIWVLLLKIYVSLVCIFVFATQINWSDSSILEWIWPDRNAADEFGTGIQGSLPTVPFEISEPNNFILDTSNMLGIKLSESDICQQKVILALKSSCKTLSDDELGKLTIALMNCQNMLEGKSSIDCSHNMQLKLCISQMSPEFISSYNLLLKKTKSVCFSIRQDQFRGMAEITVNRLIDSAHQHLGMVDRIKTSHLQLEKATLQSIDEVVENQLKLIEKQKDLMKLADSQRISGELNLKETQRIKNNIKSGHIELNSFIENIKFKLKESLLNTNEQTIQANYIFKNLFSKLTHLNEVSHKISLNLEKANEIALEKNLETIKELQEIILKVNEVNKIVQHVFKVLIGLKDGIVHQFEFLNRYLGHNDLLSQHFILVAIHFVYVLIWMLCLVFINADMKSRYILLITVFIHLIATLNNQIIFDMALLTKTIFVLLIINGMNNVLKPYEVSRLMKRCAEKITKSLTVEAAPQTDYESFIRRANSVIQRKRELQNNTTDNNTTDNNNNNSNNNNINNNDSSQNNDSNQNNEPVEEINTDEHPAYTPSLIRAPSISLRQATSEDDTLNLRRNGTPRLFEFGGRCKAITRQGSQCQFMSSSLNTDVCRIHSRASYDR